MTETDDVTPSPRRPHKFQPGQSGNPAGRPKGTRCRATVMAEAMLDDDAEKVVQAVIAAAKAGDPVAMKLCFDRLYPLRRGGRVVLTLPPIVGAADVSPAIAAIVAAVSEGIISPEEGSAVAGIVEVGRKAIELADIEARLASLEAQNVR